MPTENRSSNTEMVSVPPYIGLEPLVGRYYPAQCRRCGWVGSSEGLTEDDAQCTRHVGDRLCLGDCDELERHDLLNIIQAMAAPQPHPEPIAWMVGTAFWWTKKEAERDAAETGLPVVVLGPMAMAAHAVQHQGELVALPLRKTHKKGNSPMQNAKNSAWNACLNEIAKLGPLYTHPVPTDTAEVERLRAACEAEFRSVEVLNEANQKLQARLAEAQTLLRDLDDAWNSHDGKERFAKLMQKVESLSASEEPSAPNDCAICRDLGNQCMECEEGEFRQWADRHFAAADYRKTDAGVFIQDWMRHSYGAWCARGALVSKK